MFGLIIGILFLVYVIAALIGVAGVIFGAVFSGIGSLISGIFSGKGLVIGPDASKAELDGTAASALLFRKSRQPARTAAPEPEWKKYVNHQT